MKWLVVADQASVRVFHLDPQGHLELIDTLVNELGRVKNREMDTDKPGVGRGKFRRGTPHSLAHENTHHDDATAQFARRVREFLHQRSVAGEFSKLIFVAEPRFLGRVRAETEWFLKDKVEWISKDLGPIPMAQWPRLLGFTRLPDIEAFVQPNHQGHEPF